MTRTLALEFGACRDAAAHRRRDRRRCRKRRRSSCPARSSQQYLFDGGADVAAADSASGSRLAPFVAGGAGYLRQLHEDRTLAETGQIYYAGGGARYWLRGGHGTGRGRRPARRRRA